MSAPTAARTRQSSGCSLFIVAGALAALASAVSSPFAVAALGLMVFGMLHITLELRYVIGRFGEVLRGPFIRWLVVLMTGVLLARGLYGVVPETGRIEVAFGFAVLAAGCRQGRAPRHAPAPTARTTTALAASLIWVSGHFFALTHVHNLIPVVFLWDWSRRLAPSVRRWFLGAQLGWAVVLPTAIVLGAFDRWLTGVPAWLAPAPSGTARGCWRTRPHRRSAASSHCATSRRSRSCR